MASPLQPVARVHRHAVPAGLLGALLLAVGGAPAALAANASTAPVVAASAAGPRIAAIRFEGNRVTRESVMLRELALAVGDRASDEALLDSRQALLDLGLFREVELALEPLDADADDDAAALRVRVREKRYVLPLPRLDGSSDSDFSYGLQLRWANVGGRNHRLNLFVEEGDFSNERDRDRERMTRLSYQAPYLFDSPYEGQLQLQRIDRQRSAEAGGYDERFDRLQLALLRDFRRGRPRQGWQHGAGLVLEEQENSGPGAPPDDGTTTALLGISRYDDRRFHVYSETGTQAAARIEAAFEGAGSDFGYRLLTVEATHGMAVGTREHQTLQGRVEAGVYSGGTRRRDTFSLGGSGRLRGYDTDFLEGQRYGYATVEYLRPLRWNWLRLLVMAEAGAVGGNLAGRHDGSLHASVGVGVRLRLPWFVDVEFEAGLAWPLRGGDGMEVFAGGN